ncbi:MAG: hypothetical protein GY941_18570 [Planctomycetes bacterium]|nr:hypothetical protein [Planctomycetota bacterium]
MAKTSIYITIHVKWWLAVYIRTLCLLCQVFNTVPDMEKVARIIKSGVRIKMGGRFKSLQD